MGAMNLTILQPELRKALGIVQRAVPRKPYLPALSSVLLRTVEGRLSLTVTDLETRITHFANCRVEEEGALLIPALALSGLVAALPVQQPVTLTAEQQDLALECGSYRARLRGMAVEDYPGDLPFMAPGWHIDAATLKTAIDRTVFCAADSDARAVLQGVYFDGQDSGLVLVASDGFRMGVARLDAPAEGLSAILPKAGVRELGRLLGSEGMVAIAADHNRAVFGFGDTTVELRRIGGTFPDYPRLLPTAFDCTITANRQALLDALAVAALSAGRNASGYSIIRVDPGEMGVVVSGIDPETGESRIDVEAAVTETPKPFGLNAAYFRDALEAVECETMILEVANGPVQFRGEGVDSWQGIVMQMAR